MSQKSFVNLHAHSFYSILESSAAPADLAARAAEVGCDSAAITDRGNGHGLVEFFVAAEKVGIKPILGAEIAVAADSRFEKRPGIDGREGGIVLLAKNQNGYQNLLQILSAAHLEGFYYQPRADAEVLQKFSADLFVLTGGASGFLGKSFFAFGPKKATENAEKLQEIFGAENVFFELVARDYAEQKEFNAFLIKNFKTKNWIATSDARYCRADDEKATDVLHCIKSGNLVSDPNRFPMAERNWFKNWDEICADLDFAGAEILETSRQNSLEIAQNCSVKIEFDQKLLPQVADKNPAEKLKKSCEKALKNFGQSRQIDTKIYRERLEYELGVIAKMGFESYFLMVQDFVDFARQNQIAVGPGRGSAAGSLVSYLLGITSVDPIEFELLFERFLNPARISMPDIDIDFSDERREEVFQYAIEKYGSEKVSKVCTFGTLAAKAALKDVGRAMGIDFAQMNRWTKLLPNVPGFKLSGAEKITDFRTMMESNENLKSVFEIARKLEGCVRHVSVHACAIIIGGENLTRFCPIQWAPGAEEVKITQFPYEQLESIGLLKMDFLGLRNLSILEKSLQNIARARGQKIELDQIPQNDEKTFKTVFATGQTTGVFQFESAGMRRYLQELGPTEFEDLVAMNALFRPGPMEYIPQYISGKHAPEKVKYLHPILQPILQKTYGIAVYQEQVLRIARDFAGFSLGEADLLRKAIGKKIAEVLSAQREKFIAGAVQKGHQKKMAEKIFDEIVVPFSGYGFNRSHAVCYARIAYETAYLRAHFPVEFMAALLTVDRNNTDRIILDLNEAAAMEISVLPPSINESGGVFTVISDKSSHLGNL